MPMKVANANAKRKRKFAIEEEVETKVVVNGDTVIETTKKRRKTKEEKEAEAMPLASRTIGSKIFLGAHVSASGGVQNAVTNCVHVGGNAFALFLKSQRKWTNPPLKPEHATMFKNACSEHKFLQNKHTVPHGSYLVNLAHTDKERTKQAYDSFVDDLERCEELGIELYNFHPGNCASSSRDDAIAHLAEQLNLAHRDERTGNVVTVLETMAAAGNCIGSTFEELSAVISKVKDKSRVAVCLDTCHIFAAGYDLRSPAAYKETMKKFDDTIGLKYLRAFHVNDSKAPLGSHRDLHANIGTGFLGLRAFHNLVNDPSFWGIPMVLETPIDIKDERGKTVEDKSIWAKEIKLLESLVGMDADCQKFAELEMELQAQGDKERARIQDQVDRKLEKDKKGAAKKRGRKPKEEISTSDEDSQDDDVN